MTNCKMDNGFPVVGVGASAGGLDALKALLGGVRGGTSMSFVVVQHLDPAGESHLPELLSAHCVLPVKSAVDGMVIEPGHVYIIPPNTNLEIVENRVLFTPLKSRPRATLRIDTLFKSLAINFASRAIGIVLSGMGADGSIGVKAVKNSGGLVAVQNPEEAAYDGMPRNAIATGVVDLILPAGEIAAALNDYVAHGYVVNKGLLEKIEGESDALSQILDILEHETSHDFRPYKHGTLLRRIGWRMAVRQVKTLDSYAALLLADQAEVRGLFKDLLVNVTGFFRDAEEFAFFEREVVPRLIERGGSVRPFRAWVAGCSTGEEAYTIAMLLLEAAERVKSDIEIRVFASDLDDAALRTARTGRYPESIEAEISPDRLARFFSKEGATYQVKPALRECVVFARHDLLTDAPFSDLDLVSCRNLLIYLKPEAQERVLSMFHFALNAGGMLFLGKSESTGAKSDLFEPVFEKNHLYRRIARRVSARPGYLFLSDRSARSAGWKASSARKDAGDQLAAICNRALTEAYAPTALLMTQKFEGLYFHGDVGRYLKVPAGELRHDVLAMVHEDLRPCMRIAVRDAADTGDVAEANGVIAGVAGAAPLRVRIVARPLSGDAEDLMLVCFFEPTDDIAIRPKAAIEAETSIVRELEKDPDSTRRELQRTIHELEESNEELEANNEEMMSINEELQSTNEELETSKEELQSLNEELGILNHELQHVLATEQQVTNDLRNILTSSDIVTLMLDAGLNIRFFTPNASSLFNIVETDTGRSLTDLTTRFRAPELFDEMRRVCATPRIYASEILADHGRWYNCVLQPYRTQDGRTTGVVATFSDITALKKSELERHAAQTFAEGVVDSIRAPLVVLDSALAIVSASQAFYRFFSLTPADAIGRRLNEVGGGLLNNKALPEVLEKILSDSGVVDDFRLDLDLPNLGERAMLLTARVLSDVGTGRKIVVTMEDVTERNRTVQQQFQTFVDSAPDAMVIVDRHSKIGLVNAQSERLFGYTPGTMIGNDVANLFPLRLRAGSATGGDNFIEHMLTQSERAGTEIVALAPDGREIPVEISISQVVFDGEPAAALAIRDVTDKKSVEMALREARETAETANRMKSQFLSAASHDLRQPLQSLTLIHAILVRQKHDTAAKQAIDKLGNLLAMMTDMVDALLDINMLEAGVIEPEKSDVPAQYILDALKSEFDDVAAMNGLGLRVVSCSAVVRTDMRLLSRILQNIVANAVKYTNSGKVLLGCRRRGTGVVFEVWDTGIGIPADQTEAIFGEFHHLDGLRPGVGGLGLGLSIVQRLSDLLGHKVSVRSEVGRGSVFAVEVALGDRDAVAHVPMVSAVLQNGGPANILLIEDEPELRDGLRALLEVEGYQTAIAESGLTAVDMVRAKDVKPTLVIADYNLPGDMTGVDAVLNIGEFLGRRVPAIVMTGDIRKETYDQIAAANLLSLNKPVRPDELLAVIGAILRGRERPEAQSQSSNSPASTGVQAVAGTRAGSAPRPVVLVVDDDASIRDLVRDVLELEGYEVRTFADAETFLRQVEADDDACIVVDVGLPGMDGLALQNALAEKRLDFPVIVFSGRHEIRLSVEAMRRGAVDFLEKPISRSALLHSVERALALERRGGKARSAAPAAVLERLTAREREVMALIVDGYANKEIAFRLKISQRTVEKHRARIMDKAGARSLADLVRMSLTGEG